MEKVSEILNHYKWPLLLCLVGLVLILGGIFSSHLLPSKSHTFDKSKDATHTPTLIRVDISGAVVKSGVLSLAAGTRVEDVIKAAGGLSASASANYVSKVLNLSAKVSDGQKIYIPYEGEVLPNGAFVGTKVGINSASFDQINNLPGITDSTAQKIISGRPYYSLYDLVSKKVISKTTYERIKDLIDLN